MCVSTVGDVPEEDVRAPGVGITGSHEPPDMGAGIRTQTLTRPARALSHWPSLQSLKHPLSYSKCLCFTVSRELVIKIYI